MFQEQVKKILSSKQLSETIGKQAAASVETVINQKCRELFEQKLAPQFARAMEESTKQVAHVFQVKCLSNNEKNQSSDKF